MTNKSDDEKAIKHANIVDDVDTGTWHGRYASFKAGLREARTESLAEIAQLRELLERAIPFIQQLVNDYAPSETKKERKILADYAALTKGEK